MHDISFFGRFLSFLLFLVVAWSSPVVADTPPAEGPAATVDMREKQRAAVARLLQQKRPRWRFDRLEDSPLPGMFLLLDGIRMLHLSNDGRYAISGDVYDMESGANLSQGLRQQARQKIVAEIPLAELLVYLASGPKKNHIYVLTDTTCPFCARFHKEVPALNSAGIEVRYLLYPRAGLESSAAKEMISVWCASDQHKALSVAKRREPLPERSCDNPVAKHYAIGQRLGLSGTPMIVLRDGTVVEGYRPAKELLPLLN